MTGLVVLASIAAYLIAGARFGTLNYARRNFAHKLDQYPILYRTARERRALRRESLGEGLIFALIWPLYVAWLALAARADDFIPETDVEARERIAEQDRRIADLERELLRRSA